MVARSAVGSAAELADVTVESALAHPTWSMGPKITIDSSTLMNKGLEVIEAHELYGTPYDRIDVVVHPQSVIHSMVEFTDGSTIAQLSMPDMRLPIGYALGYPRRIASPFGAIDWTTLGRLDFEPPDRSVFRCLDLAYEAGRVGGTAPAWLSAANEVAVDAFLAGYLPWNQIPDVCVGVMQRHDGATPTSVDDVIEADRDRPSDRNRTAAAGSTMTDQLTPLDKEGQTTAPAFAPPTRIDRAKSEIMAGGAVSEHADDEVAGGWQGFLAMAGIAALFVWLATVNIWIFVFVVGVVISIFLHELGHYMTARATGMKVTQFFLFFGPRLWSFRRGETEYGVRALPLGAFVRIIGMNRMDEVEPADEGAHLPAGDLPAATARDLRRLDHAHPDRHRVAVRRVLHAGRTHGAGRARGDRGGRQSGICRRRTPASVTTTTSCRSPASRSRRPKSSARRFGPTTPAPWYRWS